MIRKALKSDLFEINDLLKMFNIQYNDLNYNSDFRNIIVYEDVNGIIGTLVFQAIYDRAEIEYIVVSNEYKNLGIGTKMLSYIEQDNFKNITLEVRESNVAAINFYKKNGFEIAAIRKNYYNEENGYLMIKNLGD